MNAFAAISALIVIEGGSLENGPLRVHLGALRIPQLRDPPKWHAPSVGEHLIEAWLRMWQPTLSLANHWKNDPRIVR